MEWNGLEWNGMKYVLIFPLHDIYMPGTDTVTDTVNRSRRLKVCSLSRVIYLKLSCQNKLEDVNTCIKLLCVSHKKYVQHCLLHYTSTTPGLIFNLSDLIAPTIIPPVCSWDIICSQIEFIPECSWDSWVRMDKLII